MIRLSVRKKSERVSAAAMALLLFDLRQVTKSVLQRAKSILVVALARHLLSVDWQLVRETLLLGFASEVKEWTSVQSTKHTATVSRNRSGILFVEFMILDIVCMDVWYWVLVFGWCFRNGQHNEPFYRSVARPNRMNGGEYLIGQYLLSGYNTISFRSSNRRTTVVRLSATCRCSKIKLNVWNLAGQEPCLNLLSKDLISAPSIQTIPYKRISITTTKTIQYDHWQSTRE